MQRKGHRRKSRRGEKKELRLVGEEELFAGAPWLSENEHACGDDVNTDLFTLVSRDGIEMQVSMQDAKLSHLLTSMLEGICPGHILRGGGGARFTMPIQSSVLARVCSYLEHHQGKPAQVPAMPLRSRVMKDVCEDAWDAEFLDDVHNKSVNDLYDLTIAADFLDIECLLHLCSAKIASLIKGRPLHRVKDILRGKVDSECVYDS